MSEGKNDSDKNIKEKLEEIIKNNKKECVIFPNNNFDVKEDESMLDNLLSGQDSIARKETIEELIKQREELKNKKIEEIKHQKSEISDLRCKALDPYHPNIKLYNELTKLYSVLDQLSVEEEIKAWKDITFLQLKKMDENGGFYVSTDENFE